MPVWTTTIPANKPTKILMATKNRIAFTIFNDSNYDVYLGFDAGVATSGNKKGVRISKSGGSFEEKDHKGTIYIISATAAEITIEDVVSAEQG
jgi:hypothetical protein